MTNSHGGLSYTPSSPFDATWKCICKNGITGVKCVEEKIENFCRHRRWRQPSEKCHQHQVSFTSQYNCRPNDLINHRRALVMLELSNAIQRGQQGLIFKSISMEYK